MSFGKKKKSVTQQWILGRQRSNKNKSTGGKYVEQRCPRGCGNGDPIEAACQMPGAIQVRV